MLARQIISAATSIGANIAEGHGRYTPGAHGNHLSIATGSTAATDSWLDLLRREGRITPEEEAALHAECMEIMAILKSKILDLERLEQSRQLKIREAPTAYEPGGEPPIPFGLEDYI